MGSNGDRLERAERELRASADEVNQLLSEAEALAVAINPGEVVCLPIGTYFIDEVGQLEATELLGLARVKDRWRLAWGETIDDVEVHWTPILECSLDDRIRASGHVRELFEKIIHASEAKAGEAKKAAIELREVLGTFGHGGGRST